MPTSNRDAPHHNSGTIAEETLYTVDDNVIFNHVILAFTLCPRPRYSHVDIHNNIYTLANHARKYREPLFVVTTLPDSKSPDAIGDVVTFSPSSN